MEDVIAGGVAPVAATTVEATADAPIEEEKKKEEESEEESDSDGGGFMDMFGD